MREIEVFEMEDENGGLGLCAGICAAACAPTGEVAILGPGATALAVTAPSPL